MLSLIRLIDSQQSGDKGEELNSILANTPLNKTLEEIKQAVQLLNGSEITKIKARNSYPLDNLDDCIDFMLHSASVSHLEIIGVEKQSALVFAAKKNRPDLMLAMVIGRKLKMGNEDIIAKQEHLDEALFWGVFHGNYTTVKTCLELGSNINAMPVLHNISTAELARHLGYKQVVELFADKEGENYEEYKDLDIPNIKHRYAKIALETAKKCYPASATLQVGYAALLTERFLEGKYIKHQLRKILKKYDDITLSSIDSGGDLFNDKEELPNIPHEVVRQICAKGINVLLPKFDQSLVSAKEIHQIYQELLVANSLGQIPHLSLERHGMNNESTQVELPEAFKNTLTGQVLIFTDQIQKQFWCDTIYLAPQSCERIAEGFPSLLFRSRANDYNLHFSGEDVPQNKSEYLAAVKARFEQAGGIATEQMLRFSLGYTKVRAQFMKEHGFIKWKRGAGRWKNTNYQLMHNGNSIFCSQSYALYEDQTYVTAAGEEVTFHDDSSLTTAKYITENVQRVPEFAKFFELLKVIYSLQPIAELAVAHGVTPDFGHMPLPEYISTPDDIIVYYYRKLPENQESADLSIDELATKLNALGDNSINLTGGTDYTKDDYKKQSVSGGEDLEKDKMVIGCPLFAGLSQDRSGYNRDDMPSLFSAVGSLFYTLGNSNWATPACEVTKALEQNPDMTVQDYACSTQIKYDQQKHGNTLVELVQTVAGFIPQGSASNNRSEGQGGFSQAFFGSTVNSKTQEYESILHSTGNAINLKSRE